MNNPAPRCLWRSEASVPASLAGGIVTIGNFDGVHLGHRHVIDTLVQQGRERGLIPRALTFRPHPRHVMTGLAEPDLITSYDDRSELVLDAGVEGLLDMEFTREFARLSAEEFVREYLVGLLGARAVLVGRDAKFGRGNEGDFSTMLALGETMGFEVLSVEEKGSRTFDCERISSSRVRREISDGNVEAAASMLGRWHFVSDTVRHGFKRGRELGFPTANFSANPRGLVPADGVYSGFFTVMDGDRFLERHPATISVGTNPTFENGPKERIVETYVHGSHDYDLYDREVRVEFVSRQRGTVAFEGVDKLIEQMHSDVAVTRSTLETARIPQA